jgi:hypothetical protein
MRLSRFGPRHSTSAVPSPADTKTPVIKTLSLIKKKLETLNGTVELELIGMKVRGQDCLDE